MGDFKTKIERWQRMQELTEQASNAVRVSLYPLLSVFSNRIGEIVQVSRDWHHKYMTVQHVDHASGGPYYHDIHIPIDVWNADDPVAAAHAYKAKAKLEREAAERQATIDAIAALQRKLDTATGGKDG